MNPPKWTFRALAFAAGVAAVVALAPRVDAQPKADPKQPKVDPKANPKGEPKNPPKGNPQPKGSGIVVQPQAPPGLVKPFDPTPFFNRSPFYNPPNPFVNPFGPNPLAPNPFAPSPFAPNPFSPNPFNNPFAPNPFNNPLNNPFAPNPFAPNPFAPNPFNNNPFINPFAPNPFGPNPFGPNRFGPNPFDPNMVITGCFGPPPSFAPPISIRQPGHLQWRGPDLLVNPWAGLVYRPLTGVARTADGTVFYHVQGTGLPTITGADAYGTGIYFSPTQGTYLNPNTGVITRPGTNVFLPWIP